MLHKLCTKLSLHNLCHLCHNSKKECIAEEFATAEARIIDTILHGYNSDIRPSINGTGSPVQVRISKISEHNSATQLPLGFMVDYVQNSKKLQFM